MKGIETYRTRAGFCVLRLHYTADPAKDPSTQEGQEWLKNALKGIPGGMKSAQWRREMEIDFSAGGGELVFQEELFQAETEIYIDPFEIPAHWKRYASFDYGQTNPTSIHFYAVNEAGWKYSYFEIYKPGLHYKDLCRLFKSHPDFNKLEYITADPSLWKKDQHLGPWTYQGFTSLADLFNEEGVHLMPHCQNSDIKGIERIRAHWRLPAGQKALYIFKNCPKQWWELRNLKYQENKNPIEHSNPEKIVDRDNHSFDDLKYFILSLPDPSEPVKKKRGPGMYRDGYVTPDGDFFPMRDQDDEIDELDG